MIMLRIIKFSNIKHFYSIVRKLITAVTYVLVIEGTNFRTKRLLTFLIKYRSCSRNFICLPRKTKAYYIVDVKIGNVKA